MSRSAPCHLTRLHLDRLQAGVLLLSAPLLLFPTRLPVATAGAALVIAAVLILRWRTTGPPPVTALNAPLALWLTMVAIGAAVSAFPDATLPKLTGILLGAFTWLTIVQTVRTRRRLTLTLYALAAIGVAIAAAGVLTTNWPTKIPILSTLITRLPTGLVTVPSGPDAGTHANELAGALLPFLPLTLSFLIAALSGPKALRRLPRREPLWGVPGAAATLSLSALLLLTQSRSGWIGAAAGTTTVIALWIRRLPRNKLRTALIALLLTGIAVALATAIWLGPSGIQRLLNEPAQLEELGGTNTIGFRIEVWRWAIMAAQDFAFTGCGLGAFRQVGRLLYPINIAVNYDYAHAHNIFLQVALDTGIPGLIAYLSLVGLALRACLRAIPAAPRPHTEAPARKKQTGAINTRGEIQTPLAIGLFAALIALHTYGLTDAIAPGAKPGLILWMMLGIATTFQRAER